MLLRPPADATSLAVIKHISLCALTILLAGGALVSAAVTIYFAVSPPTVHEARTARVGLRPYAGGTGLELSGNF